MADVKTVRILFTDKTKDIPVTLYDSYLKQTVILNPDAIVSEEYAKELLRSFSCYAQIGKDENVDKSGYKIRPDYMQDKLKFNFDKLTPNEKEVLVGIAEKMFAERNKKVEDENQTQVASEVVEPPPAIKPQEIKQEPPSQPSPQDTFKEEERMAQDILRKLQDKKINKPRWAL